MLLPLNPNIPYRPAAPVQSQQPAGFSRPTTFFQKRSQTLAVGVSLWPSGGRRFVLDAATCFGKSDMVTPEGSYQYFTARRHFRRQKHFEGGGTSPHVPRTHARVFRAAVFFSRALTMWSTRLE